MKLFIDRDFTNDQSMMGQFENVKPGGIADVVIIGDNPSKYRASLRGNPIAGPKSVEFINKWWQMYFGTVPTSYWTFLVKYPSNLSKGNPSAASLKTCYEPMLKELDSILPPMEERIKNPPRIIVTGKETAKRFCEGYKSIKDDHGVLFFNTTLNCYFMPMYHFHHVANNPEIREIILHDLKRFFEIKEMPEPQVIPLTTPMIKTIVLVGKVYLDIETTSLDPYTGEITSIGFCSEKNDRVYAIENPTVVDMALLYDLIKEHNQPLVMHNGTFDLRWLQLHAEVPETDWTSLEVRDTSFYAHVQGEYSKGLKHLTSLRTMRPGPHAFGGFESLAYLGEDVLSTKELEQYYGGDEYADKTFSLQLMHRAIPIFTKMRNFGVHFDMEKKDEVKQYLKDVSDKARKKVFSYKLPVVDFNPNSTAQVGAYLKMNGVPLREKTKSGAFATNQDVLQSFVKHQVVKDFIEYKKAKKNDTFIEGYEAFLLHDGKLHPNLKLRGTDTGRLSCADPNLQQVPRVGPVKTCFPSRFENGLFGLVDLDRAELVMACMMANDHKFAQALLTDDVHRTVASMIHEKPPEDITKAERKASKSITFGLLYGGSDAGLAFRSGLQVEDVTRVRLKFLAVYDGINKLLEKLKQEVVTTQRNVSPFGRIRNLEQLIALKGVEDAKRKATNTPIQGTASDIMLSILINTAEQLTEAGAKSYPIFGVHDSAMFDIHPDELQLVADCLQESFRRLGDSPLVEFELYDTLAFTGTLYTGPTWASVEDTNENFEEGGATFHCTSLPEPSMTEIIEEGYEKYKDAMETLSGL